MKNLTILVLFLFGTISLNAQSIEGLWNTGKENTVVKIQKSSDGFVGKVHSSDHSKAPIGKMLLKDIKKVGDVYEGKIFAVKKKKWLNATFNPKNNKLFITVSAGFMKRKVEWKKES